MGMTWIALAAAYALFIYVEYVDAKVSKYYPLYDTGEENWLARGKDGQFSMSKSIRNTIIVGGALFATAFLPMEYVRYFLAGTVAAGSGAIWSVVSKNARRLKEQKARQFDILENFTGVKTTSIKPFKDQWVYGPGTSMGGGTTFYDIRAAKLGHVDDMTERARAATVLTERFLKLKGKKEIWWSLERAKQI